MKPNIGISIGDINGIGPELILQSFADGRLLDFCTPIVYANSKVFNHYRKNITDGNLQLNAISDYSKVNPKQVNVFTCWSEDVTIEPGKETTEAGQCAIKSLLAATQALQDGKVQAIVTLPICKNNTQSKDFPYTGHTPFLKDKFKAKDVAMLLVTEHLRVALLTEHVPVADIAKHVTKEKIASKVAILHQALKIDFGIAKPRIALLALNPHAGDGGLIGKEETEIIIPTILELSSKGYNVHGPYAADGFFARQHDSHFDAVLAMYHDQGLIPFKSFDKAQGVNYTAGLPVVRTSPDHGTAFDIAGKGIANTASFLEALYTAIDILRQRSDYATHTANPLKRGSGAASLKKNKSREDIEQ